MNREPSRAELLDRLAELEARLATYETGQTKASSAGAITESKRTEAAPQEADERLRLLLEYHPASIALFDREMRYLAASRSWRAEYLGGVQCVIGQSHYEIFPECPECWRAAHRRGQAGEIVQVNEDVWHRADGSEIWAR